jgi:hypothetical protein
MGTRDDRNDAEISAELLEQLSDQAQLLVVFDEGQDVALDLHEALFSPDTRTRTLAFLNSDRYRDAVDKFHDLTQVETGAKP